MATRISYQSIGNVLSSFKTPKSCPHQIYKPTKTKGAASSKLAVRSVVDGDVDISDQDAVMMAASYCSLLERLQAVSTFLCSFVLFNIVGGRNCVGERIPICHIECCLCT